MAGLNTLEASNVVLPKDLVITAQPNIDTNYFTVTAKGLELDSSYNFQFQWVYADGTVGPWSPSVFLITPTESVPGAPSVSVPGISTAYIPVTLNAFPANALRVDVKITGGDFGIGKVAHSFLNAGTTTIPAAAGVYYVELYTITPTNINGTPTSAFTITVSDNTVPILAPETPDVPTAKAGLASVIVEWNGKKTGGTNFTTGSFAGAKVFIGTTAGFIPSDDNWVHTLNFANGSNKVSIGVGTVINKTAGTLLAYGTPYYIKIDTINANGTANNNPVAASGVPVTVSKLPASEISTGTITADNSITAGVSGGQRVVISGSAAPFIIYGTDGTTKLLEYVTGGTTGSLSIKGSGTFTGSLEIGTGNNIFKADPSIGIWLGNTTFGSANFRVSTTGILTALAGNVGGWTISSTQLTSGGTDYISLTPGTPRISIVKTTTPNAGTITIDPIEGIKATNFQLTPNGNLTLNGDVTAKSFLTTTANGAYINIASTSTNKIDFVNSADNGYISATATSFGIGTTGGNRLTFYNSNSTSPSAGTTILQSASYGQIRWNSAAFVLESTSYGHIIFNSAKLEINNLISGGSFELRTNANALTIATSAINRQVNLEYSTAPFLSGLRNIISDTAVPPNLNDTTGYTEGDIFLVRLP